MRAPTIAGLVAGLALAGVVVAQWAGAPARRASARASAPAATSAAYFPNVTLTTHENRRLRFLDDVFKGRTVAINFMFTSCSGVCPRSTANLRKVQDLLHDRLGKDVLMLSISVDPETDTPEVLRRYAEEHGVKPGWLFLTGEAAEIDRLRRRLASGDDADPAQHTGMLTFGNDAAGQWRMINVTTTPERIARDVRRLADGMFW